jgi:uncharacterized protein (DUF302 family)
VRLDLSYDEAIETVTTALQNQGFGLLTEIDVKATLKKKLDVDFRRYVILGACNPTLAHQALTAELEIGLLMPCNVIVYEDGDGSVVSIADPNAMVEMTGSTRLEGVAAEARAKLQLVIDALEQ